MLPFDFEGDALIFNRLRFDLLRVKGQRSLGYIGKEIMKARDSEKIDKKQEKILGTIHKSKRELCDAKVALCWTYALGCIVAVVALVRAYRKHRPGATVVWRGTTYAAKDNA